MIPADMLRIRAPGGGTFSVSGAVALFALWQFGLTTALLAAAAALLVEQGLRRTGWVALTTLVGTKWTALAAAGLCWQALRGWPGWQGALVSAAVFFLVRNALEALQLPRTPGDSLARTWQLLTADIWRQQALAVVAALGCWLASGWPEPWPYVIALLAYVVLALITQAQGAAAVNGALQRLLTVPALAEEQERRHADQVVRLSLMAARELGLPSRDVENIGYAALLHTIGMPPSLSRRLREATELSPQDRQEIVAHPAAGARLIGRIEGLRDVAAIVRHHRERYDGLGYPDGLAGDAVPLGARVLAVATAFAAMTSPRPHRPARSVAAAAAELRQEAGRQFDPEVVAALLRALDRSGMTPDLPDAESVRHKLREWLGDTAQWQPGKTEAVSWLERLAMTVAGSRGAWAGTTALTAITRLGQSLNASLSPARAIEQVTETVFDLLAVPCYLTLIDRDGAPTVRGQAGLVHNDSLAGVAACPLSAAAVETGAPVAAYNIFAEYELPPALQLELRAVGARSALAVPLVSRGKSLGALVVLSQQHRRWGSGEMALLSTIAAQGALAIENARLFDELNEQYQVLRQTTTFNQIILEDIDHGILVVDRAGKPTLWNRAFRQMVETLGIDWDAAQSRPWLETTTLLGTRECPVLKTLHTGQAQQAYDLPLKGTAAELIVQLHANPLIGPTGNLLGVVSIFHDRTQRRRLEQQVRQGEKLAAVGELAAGAAHEIRNPLTALKGFIQLFSRRSEMPENDRTMLNIMLQEIDRIDSLIHSLLLLARPAKPDRRPCYVPELIDQVLMLTQTHPHADRVQVETTYAPSTPTVLLDEAQLKQVFINLIQNAYDALEDGGRLTISTKEQDGWLRVDIADDGPGMSQSVQTKLYDPFFTTKEKGTGLGLAVTFRIVHAHGGRLEVDSAPGQGTRFIVLLPGHAPAAAGPDEPSRPQGFGAPAQK